MAKNINKIIISAMDTKSFIKLVKRNASIMIMTFAEILKEISDEKEAVMYD